MLRRIVDSECQSAIETGVLSFFKCGSGCVTIVNSASVILWPHA
jgi:hypothetical protein